MHRGTTIFPVFVESTQKKLATEALIQFISQDQSNHDPRAKRIAFTTKSSFNVTFLFINLIRE